jgi:hypothetical protein
MEMTDSSIGCNDDENSNDPESDDSDKIEPPSKRARTCSVFSLSSKQDSLSETTTNMSKHPLAQIDPTKVARKIKDILSFANIRQRLFAKEVIGISFCALKKTLNPHTDRPLKQWAECTSEMKRRYHIMHEWSQAPDKSIEHLRAIGLKKYGHDENIDLVLLMKEVSAVLKDAKISREFFGKEVLGISKSQIFNMLDRPPKSWIQSTDRTRQRYKKMHEWIQSPKESIEHLKIMSNKRHRSDDEIIDTIELCNSIKNILIQDKIPQSNVAKEVLGISRSALCRIINKPTPWAMCKVIRKDIFRKLNEWRKSRTRESILSLKALSDSRKLSECVGVEEVLDTFELVDRVTKLLKKLGISKVELGRDLDISHSNIIKLIFEYPAPWNLLTTLKKEYYRKLHAWLLKSDEEEDDQHSSASEEEGDEDIDTFKVSREIVQLLKVHGIPHTFFAKITLRISPVHFGELVTNTKQWKDLHNSQRKIFKNIEKWTLAKSEEIKALKQKYLVSKAKAAIISRNSYCKRKLV